MKAGGGFEGKDRDSFMSLYSRLKRLGYTVLLIYSSLHRFFFYPLPNRLVCKKL